MNSKILKPQAENEAANQPIDPPTFSDVEK